MKKEKSCGCIVLDNNRVLVIKHNAGHYSFPKGHQEPGETDEQTAIREVKEETNLEVEIISDKTFINTYSPKPGVIKDVIFFIARPLSFDIKNQESEVCEVLFEDVNIALEHITHEADRKILESIITGGY